MSKQFSDATILSCMTGWVLVDFGDIHECLEVLAGGPVWTHQMPSLFKEIRPAMQVAFPDLATVDISGISPETFPAWKAAHPELYANSREVKPLGDYTSHPLAAFEPGGTLAHMAVSVVETK